MTKNNKEFGYICDLCQQDFGQLDKLTDHFVSVHGRTPPVNDTFDVNPYVDRDGLLHFGSRGTYALTLNQNLLNWLDMTINRSAKIDGVVNTEDTFTVHYADGIMRQFHWSVWLGLAEPTVLLDIYHFLGTLTYRGIIPRGVDLPDERINRCVRFYLKEPDTLCVLRDHINCYPLPMPTEDNACMLLDWWFDERTERQTPIEKLTHREGLEELARRSGYAASTFRTCLSREYKTHLHLKIYEAEDEGHVEKVEHLRTLLNRLPDRKATKIPPT